MARRFDHVAFDLDGTLIDSRADLAASVNHVLASLGRPQLPSEQLVAFVGDGARMLVQRALAAVGDDRVSIALDRFLAHYGSHLLDRTHPYSGIPSLLNQLSAADVVLSLESNKPEAMCRTILDGLGWLPRFVAVLGGDSVTRRKPDPAGVRCALAASGASPERKTTSRPCWNPPVRRGSMNRFGPIA